MKIIAFLDNQLKMRLNNMKAFRVEGPAKFTPVQIIVEITSLEELTEISRQYRRFVDSTTAGHLNIPVMWALLECAYYSLVDEMERCLPNFTPVKPRELSQDAEQKLKARPAKVMPRLRHAVGGAV